MLECEHLHYQYPQSDRLALCDIQVEIVPGEFVLLLGESGSGKSTFLRALNGLVPRFYGGAIAGNVRLHGQSLDQLTQRQIVTSIGFLNQDPERQLLLDTVRRELAFSMENLSISPEQMRSRFAEISHLFGLGPKLSSQTDQLSGGEKQRLALASILTLFPSILLLDEPTSQLDPVHADEVLQLLRRLHEEMGMTIVMSEHRMERCYHLADRILYFDQGRIRFDGTPRQFAASAIQNKSWLPYLPVVAQGMAEYCGDQDIPLTVKEARKLVQKQKLAIPLSFHPGWGNVTISRQSRNCEVLSLRLGTAGYREKPDVLRQLNYCMYEGDRIALFGENGAGKSTFAKALVGTVPLTSGELQWFGKPVQIDYLENTHRYVGYLSQNPNDYFMHETVEEELLFTCTLDKCRTKEEIQTRVDEILSKMELTSYQKHHPHDLSGGERQRLALAILLASEPEVLILDEPTRGMDRKQKVRLAEYLRVLPAKAVLLITHDVEFALLYANRISVLYDGTIVTDNHPQEVFTNSLTYAPQMYRVLRKNASLTNENDWEQPRS
ncbi:ABC transporter ATP-binding protein [Brevibacillus fortis]|nr:ABC transporter ATP-binding protein [Brevibacillus fortis]